jgi:hypothetical protein
MRSRCFGGMYVERTTISAIMVNMPSQLMINGNFTADEAFVPSPLDCFPHIKLFLDNLETIMFKLVLYVAGSIHQGNEMFSSALSCAQRPKSIQRDIAIRIVLL